MEFRSKQIFNDGSEEAYAVTMVQLKIPLIVSLSLMTVACVIFIIEVIVYRIKKIQNRELALFNYVLELLTL